MDGSELELLRKILTVFHQLKEVYNKKEYTDAYIILNNLHNQNM